MRVAAERLAESALRRARRLAEVAPESHPTGSQELTQPGLAITGPTRPAINFHNCLLTALTSTPFARRLTVAVGRTPDGPLAHLEVLAQHQTRCEPLGARRAHKKRVTDAPYALLAAAVDRSCTNTAAAVLPGLRLVRYRRPWSSFLLSRSSRRVFLLATSLVASASISRCFSSRR